MRRRSQQRRQECSSPLAARATSERCPERLRPTTGARQLESVPRAHARPARLATALRDRRSATRSRRAYDAQSTRSPAARRAPESSTARPAAFRRPGPAAPARWLPRKAHCRRHRPAGMRRRCSTTQSRGRVRAVSIGFGRDLSRLALIAGNSVQQFEQCACHAGPNPAKSFWRLELQPDSRCDGRHKRRSGARDATNPWRALRQVASSRQPIAASAADSVRPLPRLRHCRGMPTNVGFSRRPPNIASTQFPLERLVPQLPRA